MVYSRVYSFSAIEHGGQYRLLQAGGTDLRTNPIMDALPRLTLTRIIAKHGRGICNHPKRLEALLRDLCGAHIREINILVGALEERVTTDLMTAGKSVPREVLLTQLVRRLQDHLAYTPEAARWAADAWAVALGVLSETEFDARAQPPSSRDGTAHHPQMPSGTTRVQPSAKSSSSQATPLTVPPTVQPLPESPTAPINASQPVLTHRTHATPPLPATSQPYTTQRPPLFGWKLRGCLIGFLLLIIFITGAVFAVPAIIGILREEQTQPSINDPRIP